jgi:hypothetical protein
VVSKVNKKSISYLTRVKRTPTAAATVQVSQALPAVLSCAQDSHCTVITDLDTSKGTHRKPFPAATQSWKLAPRPRSKNEKRTAGSTLET